MSLPSIDWRTDMHRHLLLLLLLATPLPAWADTYTETKYPIVLAHGLSGFDALFGVYEYFYDLNTALSSGGATVYVTDVPAFASSEARGEALLAQIAYIVAATGVSKVNIFAHSQGGLDARYVAALRPDLVASVTTISTPHKGSGLADYLRAHLTSGGLSEDVLAFFADSLGVVLNLLTGTSNVQDAVAALDQLTSAGTAAFNAKYPQGVPASDCGDGDATANGVAYFSWGGTSALTDFLDPSDGPLGLASFFAGSSNDGLVARCSTHFGQVLRDDYDWNHLDSVNQVFGLLSLFASSPVSVFRAQANRLKGIGL
jgi:triacylglycerol lipase